MLCVDSADDKLMIFFLFPRKKDLTLHANCLLKLQILFSRKSKKNISECHLLNFLLTLTCKVLSRFVADGILNFVLLFFREKA